MKWRAGVAVAAMVALCACGGGSRPEVAAVRQSEFPGANLLLVTLDTTRADRIGCYGHPGAETPVLDGLAADGVLFESCITPTAFTLPSHASIMTGLYPPFHGVRLNGGAALADTHTTLAESLAARGYDCGAFVAAFVLDGRWGLNQGFAEYDDRFKVEPDQRLDLSGVQRPADQVVDVALEWLDGRTHRPFFAWVHLYDPHTPYDPPEPYKSRFGNRGPSGLYDGEIAFADSQVGRLLSWLETSGVADDTIVAVVGDHGEGLGDHGEKEHGFFIYDYAVRVPFIVRLPDQRGAGRRVRSLVRTVDVLPTLLDLARLESPDPIHGESLVRLIDAPDATGPRWAYSESMAINLQYGWSALYSLRTGDQTFIEAPRRELYDRAADPGESVNLAARDPELVDELSQELSLLRQRIAEGAPEVQQADVDEETLSMLAALGYVAGAASAAEGEHLADPKDKIHLYESVGYAAHLMAADDYVEAAEVLEIVLDEDPEVPQARLLLATVYLKTDRVDEAKAVLDRYLRQYPDSAPAMITMAGILSKEGRTDEVLALAKRVLSVDDRNTQAFELMAGVYMDINDHGSALPLLEKVVGIQPKLTRNRNNLAACLIGLGQLERANEILDGVIRDFPKFPMAHYHLGLLREEQGRLVDARDEYALELEHYPDNAPARFNLGNAMLRLGDAGGAEQQMRMLVDSAPELARPYLLLARIVLARSGDLDEVHRLASQGLERTEAPDLKALGYFLLADVYARQGRRSELEQAVTEAERYRALMGSG